MSARVTVHVRDGTAVPHHSRSLRAALCVSPVSCWLLRQWELTQRRRGPRCPGQWPRARLGGSWPRHAAVPSRRHACRSSLNFLNRSFVFSSLSWRCVPRGLFGTWHGCRASGTRLLSLSKAARDTQAGGGCALSPGHLEGPGLPSWEQPAAFSPARAGAVTARAACWEGL